MCKRVPTVTCKESMMCKRVPTVTCPDCGDLIPLVDDENVCANCGFTVDENGREMVIPHSRERHTTPDIEN